MNFMAVICQVPNIVGDLVGDIVGDIRIFTQLTFIPLEDTYTLQTYKPQCSKLIYPSFRFPGGLKYAVGVHCSCGRNP